MVLVPAPVISGAHGVQEALQVQNFRLPSHIVQHGLAPEQRGGHHHVLGRAHAGVVEMDGRRVHVAPVAADHAALFLHLHAQLAKAAQVQVDGAQADFAPAGQGDIGPAEPCQNGPQQKNGRTDPLGKLLGHFIAAQPARIDFQRSVIPMYAAAQRPENLPPYR